MGRGQRTCRIEQHLDRAWVEQGDGAEIAAKQRVVLGAGQAACVERTQATLFLYH